MNDATKRKSNLSFLGIGLLLTLVAFGFFGCAKESEEKRLQPALESLTAEDLAKDTQILASDEFEGRAPASQGETRTINFLREEFQKIGLKPGNGQSYFQEIPMVVMAADPAAGLEVRGDKKAISFAYKDQFVAENQRVEEEVFLGVSERGFAGYGIR